MKQNKVKYKNVVKNVATSLLAHLDIYVLVFGDSDKCQSKKRWIKSSLGLDSSCRINFSVANIVQSRSRRNQSSVVTSGCRRRRNFRR